MGNKALSASNPPNQRKGRQRDPSLGSNTNGVNLYHRESAAALYNSVPYNMDASLDRGSSGPVRPGLVKYDPPTKFQNAGSARSTRTQGQGLKAYIDRVTAVWSDLGALRDLPENSLSQATSLALAKTFERLFDNHTYATTLSKDHDHLSKQNRNLIEEREALTNTVRERDATIQRLESSLKAFQDSPRTQTHSRQGSDGFRKPPTTNVGPRSAPGGTDILTLRERVVELENVLKTYQSVANRTSPEKEVERIGEIQDQYGDLADLGISQIKPIVDVISKQMSEEEKFRLIYGVLLVAMERCRDLQDSLRTVIRKLIRHPDRFFVDERQNAEGSGDKTLEYKSSLIVRENVKMFENRESAQKDPRKNRVSEERVKTIFQSLRQLMSDEVDNCKLNNLEKEVADVLKSEYGSSIHASLWFDSKFTKYLSDCCKVAWKITLTDRKIVMDFAPYEFFNDKRHLPYRSDVFPRSRIDYFAWPILVDMDSKYVLFKGRAHFS